MFLSSPLKTGRETLTARVRNLSASGALIEAATDLEPGQHVSLELRNIGAVRGIVAWCEGGRAGVAFDRHIDPDSARVTITAGPPPRREVYRRPGLATPQSLRERDLEIGRAWATGVAFA